MSATRQQRVLSVSATRQQRVLVSKRVHTGQQHVLSKCVHRDRNVS